MKSEYEVSILDIDVEEITKKLDELDAEKKGDFFQKRYLYNFHEEYRGRFIRLRTNGKKTTLTIKDKSAKKEIGSVKELEIEVSDFEATHQIMQTLGYNPSKYQENKRTSYILDDVELELDTWPMIPTYLEIEGKSKEEVLSMVTKLGFKDEDISLMKVSEIYAKYGINNDDYVILKFDN